MSSINLSSKNIKDSQNIFFSFKEPSKIISLDLSNNNLTKIPDNLSHLTNLEKLDLINNYFEDYEAIGHALSSLPKLIDLKIDLTTQENAFLILSQLPKLLFLNGKSTSDEDEDKNQIDLNDTETDKASLKNEIPNFNSVTNRITQILTQRNERTDEFYVEFQGILKTQIDCINSLENNIPNYVYTSYIQQAKVEIYSYLQNKILNMINTKVDYLLINLLNEVNQYIKKILGETVQIIRNIYPKCEEIENNYKNEINQRDIKIDELSKQIQYLNEANNKNTNPNIFANENNNKKTPTNINNNINNNNPFNNNPFEKAEREKSPQEFNIVNNDNSNFSISYNDETKKILDNFRASNSNYNPKKKEENQIIKKITNNNSSNNLQNMTFNNNKNIIANYKTENNIINNNKNSINNHSYNNNIISNSNRVSAKKNLSEISVIKNNFNTNYINEPSLSYQPSLSNISQLSNITNAPPKDLKIVVGPISKREMTLRQLLEIINDIYNSKLENDKKLVNNRQQKLTMEQFLYHYLNNKYGLKNLVIEYASCIIQGIKDFSKKNSEILLFGKILRNEIEEQEILIVAKLKETINELLYVYYQNKFQYKSKKDIENMVKKCKTGLLNEEQWKNTINYLFSDNENDLNSLMEKIQRYIDRQNISTGNNQKYGNGNSISYQKFIQLVIDYQIKIRSIYLKNFNQIFKSIDTDHDGIISDYDFVKLVEIANVYNTREELELKTQMMIKELDKYSTGTIIYNDIINLWNKEMTFDQITGENLSLLDKLSME